MKYTFKIVLTNYIVWQIELIPNFGQPENLGGAYVRTKANLLKENASKSLGPELKSKKKKKNLFFKDHPANTLASLQTQFKIHTLKVSARLQTI